MRNLELDALVKANRVVNTPTEEARERNRRRLVARIAAGLAAGAATSALRDAAASTAGGATPGVFAAIAGGIAKWLIPLILVGGTGVGVYLARGHASTPTPTVMTSAPKEVSAPVTLSGNETSALPPSIAVPPEAAPASDAPRSPDGAASPDHAAASPAASTARVRHEPPSPPGDSGVDKGNFARELELLRSAQRALDTGSPARALALLDQYAAEFPRGALKPECQAARVLALCAAGRVSSAQQARDRFLKDQPGSPLGARLRTTCAGGR